MQSQLFWYKKMSPALKQFQKSRENRVMQSVRIIEYIKRNSNCLGFLSVGLFVYKTSCNANCHDFCIYKNENFKTFIKIA